MNEHAAVKSGATAEPGVAVEYVRGHDLTVNGGMFTTRQGAQSAVRYRQQEDHDRYATVYELQECRAFRPAPRSPATVGATAAGGATLDGDRDVRVYRQVGWEAVKAGYEANSAPIALIVGMSMEPGHLDELVEWYELEHMPMLLRVPGWQRMRRFLKVAGAGPEHLAICELASMDVFDHPDKLAAFTPWRERVIQKRIEYERVLYDAVERYPAPPR